VRTSALLLRKARSAHPMPWTQKAHVQGLITVEDANGHEVPLLFLLEVICALSIDIAEAKSKGA